MSLRGDEHGDARLHFWEMCCAATIPIYPDECIGTVTVAQLDELVQREARYCAAAADAKLAEWDKRWGRNGVAP